MNIIIHLYFSSWLQDVSCSAKLGTACRTANGAYWNALGQGMDHWEQQDSHSINTGISLVEYGDEFKPGKYYLQKRGYLINEQGKEIDYEGFNKGKGVNQSPKKL
jgi:hypothetical protein